MASVPSQPLAYYRPSPVRGQLEPYDPRTRTGTRWLQCTDTPSELRVLLPPRTAQLYAQLLKAETDELARGGSAAWDRILQIRHLKERMLRKCQRISRMVAPAPHNLPFRDIRAPPDFRLKEMEKWLKTEESSKGISQGAKRYNAEAEKTRLHSPHSARSAQLTTHTQHVQAASHTPSSRSSRAGQASRSPISQRIPSRTSATVKRRSSTSSQSTTHSHSPAHSRTSSGTQTFKQNTYPSLTGAARAAYLSPVVEERSTMTSPPLSNPHSGSHEHSSERRLEALVGHAVRPNVISPDPLPRLYRPPSINLSAPPLEMPYPVTEMPVPQPAVVEEPQTIYADSELSSIPPSLPPKEPLAPGSYADFQQGLEEGLVRPMLPRRRSSLKQPTGRSSNGAAQKVVSWAMDRDWSVHMSKFDHIVYATEIAGNALEEARTKFQQEIADVRNLRQNITAALDRLRLETDRLQFEEDALRAQEEKLTTSFEQYQEKENQYKDTGQYIAPHISVYSCTYVLILKMTRRRNYLRAAKAALEEAKRVVMAADNNRDSEVLS
ncbi:hypothetical protein EW146_g1500 [Bondarzewia mesenterica]|uniref:Uncharacterized protein n=1 Tax=Bondarzewia mesenterica TaxID=1095465 RepID=A0A4S4M5H9_9AGAM|nr:hypothetical protein EW146_g1500 [Bondarzewia mesenterica]